MVLYSRPETANNTLAEIDELYELRVPSVGGHSVIIRSQHQGQDTLDKEGAVHSHRLML